MSSRGWVVAGVVGLLVTGGAGTVVLDRSDSQDGTRHASSEPGAVVTAAVEHRLLESVIVTRGQVVSPVQVTVLAPPVPEGATKGVVTALPVAAGEVVAGGGAVVEVNGRPVLVWPSRLPMYRELRPGMSGPDVVAVQDALALLGHPVGDGERSTFGPETRAGITEVYRAAGYEPTYTLGSAAAVDAAITGAQREAEVARAAANAARAAGVIDPAADLAYENQRAEVDRVRASEGVTLQPGEVTASTAPPTTVLRRHVEVGGAAPEGAELVTVGSAELSVQVGLTAGQATALAGTLTVEVSTAGYRSPCTAAPIAPTSPVEDASSPPDSEPSADGDGDSAAGDGAGRDGGVGSVPAGETGAEHPFVLTVDCVEPLPIDLLGADVTATVTATGTDGPVQVVPATALTTGGDGTTTVDRVEATETETVVVVVVGEADGFVGVTAPDDDLREGDRVRVRR